MFEVFPNKAMGGNKLQQHKIEHNKLEEFVSLNESLHRLMQGYLTKNLNTNLSLPQMFLLDILRKNGTCTPSSIAQIMGVTSGAITSLADRLHKQGLITRERSESDRRVVMITLTDSGLELMKKVQRQTFDHLAIIFSKLPEGDIDNLISIYYRLHNVIKSMEKTKE